jgi:pentapeptide repeat protein
MSTNRDTTLLWFAAISVLVSAVAAFGAVAWGATSKDLLIGVATGLLTGALVSARAITEHMRADRLRYLDEERAQRLREQDEKRAQRLREQDEERSERLRAEALRLSVTAAASLPMIDLQGADLRGLALTGKDLRDASLGRAQLNGAWLNDCNLAGADLRHANLTGTRLDRRQHARGNLPPRPAGH